ncbi:carbon-nitrogen hydrolase family protein [Sneathiella sp. P13V-1]|uniref:carbon-nitrogen hydrolase family protein n=1 Tax=Sneathiella sp. P13V-1 TaxID=2697366 RepID=UPI00187B95F8|nr:carbon-nitrogen hydrolase family protein [Sneathiella sp. P13V-1]MBE7636552.1 carbon-nitrogen hydrolase family protein [Sneathiella sp. P13V-1]
MSSFTAACIQLTSGTEPAENLKVTTELVEEAALSGADFISTPEVTNMMEPHKAAAREKAQFEEDDITLKALKELAAKHEKWIHAGSLVIKKPDEDRLANRAFVINPKGEVTAKYDKIHMFDVELDNGETHKESSAYAPGEVAVTTDFPWGRCGLSICYDIRFSHLFQELARNGGAEFFVTPAAFTYTTGSAHWHILQRARAIENGCFVIAAAQCGRHSEKRQTYGHSIIVDPWGEILADGGEEIGITMATLDMEQVAKRRQQVPNLKNIRDFTLTHSGA